MNENSITKSINDWLLQYDKITEIAQIYKLKEKDQKIGAEELPDEYGSLALQRSGVEKLPLRYINEKGWRRQYQYLLLLKSASENDVQRIENLDWLDELSNWIEKQKIIKNYPKLKNITVTDITCANAITYEVEDDNSISAYYLQIYFDMKGEN